MGPNPRRIPVPSPHSPDRQLKPPAGSIPRTRALPAALGSPRRAGREGCSSTGHGAPRVPTRPHRRPPRSHEPLTQRPGAAPPRGRAARLPCSLRLVMSCNCFSSSELFMVTGGVGKKRADRRERRGMRRGRGEEKQDAGGCGSPTRKLDWFPLLLLLARSARVRSSPRT